MNRQRSGAGELERWEREAVGSIRLQYGVASAHDHVVGEKLIAFWETAEKHCEYSQALPYFVSKPRRMLTAENIREYLARIENAPPQRAMEARDCYDPLLEDLADLDAGPLTANLPCIVREMCRRKRLRNGGADGFIS